MRQQSYTLHDWVGALQRVADLDHYECQVPEGTDVLAVAKLLRATSGESPVYVSLNDDGSTKTVKTVLLDDGLTIATEWKAKVTSLIGWITANIDDFKAWMSDVGLELDKEDVDKRVVWFTIGGVQMHCSEGELSCDMDEVPLPGDPDFRGA